jgi:hypothetical protein
MKKILLALSLCFSAAGAFCASSLNDAVGNWKGTLEVGQMKLRVVFKVTKTPEGVLSAKMDSLDQGARDLKADTVTFKDSKLRMEVNIVQGVYEGTLDKSGEKITGQWKQGPSTIPLALERAKGPIDVLEAENLSPADLEVSKQTAQKLAGTWNGNLSTSAAELRLVLHITKSAQGAATGTIDSPDQGGKDIPVSGIMLKDGKVHFDVRGIGGKYDGTLNGDAIKGDWLQGGQSMPLNFKKAPPAK